MLETLLLEQLQLVYTLYSKQTNTSDVRIFGQKINTDISLPTRKGPT